MIEQIKLYWAKYGFEIIVCLSILIILIIAWFRKGKKGTWSKSEKPRQQKHHPTISSGEKECLAALGRIFVGKSFVKIRPEFLRNPVTGSQLELDCYNSEMKLAIEYNGRQHFEFIPFFHKNTESFQAQKYRDFIKRDLCSKHGVTLIEVPYTVKTVDIEAYLRNKLF